MSDKTGTTKTRTFSATIAFVPLVLTFMLLSCAPVPSKPVVSIGLLGTGAQVSVGEELTLRSEPMSRAPSAAFPYVLDKDTVFPYPIYTIPSKGTAVTDSTCRTTYRSVTQKPVDGYPSPAITLEYSKADPSNANGTRVIDVAACHSDDEDACQMRLPEFPR